MPSLQVWWMCQGVQTMTFWWICQLDLSVGNGARLPPKDSCTEGIAEQQYKTSMQTGQEKQQTIVCKQLFTCGQSMTTRAWLESQGVVQIDIVCTWIIDQILLWQLWKGCKRVRPTSLKAKAWRALTGLCKKLLHSYILCLTQTRTLVTVLPIWHQIWDGVVTADLLSSSRSRSHAQNSPTSVMTQKASVFYHTLSLDSCCWTCSFTLLAHSHKSQAGKVKLLLVLPANCKICNVNTQLAVVWHLIAAVLVYSTCAWIIHQSSRWWSHSAQTARYNSLYCMTADGPGCHTIFMRHHQLNSAIIFIIATWGKHVIRINIPFLAICQSSQDGKFGTTDIKIKGWGVWP